MIKHTRSLRNKNELGTTQESMGCEKSFVMILPAPETSHCENNVFLTTLKTKSLILFGKGIIALDNNIATTKDVILIARGSGY